MHIVHTVEALRERLSAEAHIALVPTMGNLHAGHIALVTQAKTLASCVVVSIFVNPLQFGQHEDLTSYPRTPELDSEKLLQAGVDVLFAPSVQAMYPDADAKQLHQSMTIKLPPVADTLCGAFRPGHFEGVATVVMKLFNIVQPTLALFGKKDFQQLFIIKEMVRQFNLSVQIVEGETVREPNGLAMSSRNGYLSQAQLAQASQLNTALQEVVLQLKKGNRAFAEIESITSQQLNQNGWEVDYISIRSALTLLPARAQDQRLVVLGAAKINNTLSGKTRLIDNIEVTI